MKKTLKKHIEKYWKWLKWTLQQRAGTNGGKLSLKIRGVTFIPILTFHYTVRFLYLHSTNYACILYIYISRWSVARNLKIAVVVHVVWYNRGCGCKWSGYVLWYNHGCGFEWSNDWWNKQFLLSILKLLYFRGNIRYKYEENMHVI